jgi:hypothetical protein
VLIDRVVRRAAIFAIAAYQAVLSPFTGGACRFLPSCSDYAAEAIGRHGAVRGTKIALQRFARCHPWGGFGIDPVPAADHPRRLEQ